MQKEKKKGFPGGVHPTDGSDKQLTMETNKWRKTEHAKRKKEGISRRGTSHRWL